LSTREWKSPPHSGEAQLIHRICQGEREAFHALVQPYERAMFTSAMAILKNTADAEEVTQEAVLKALSHLATFRGESKFSTWLIQIAINEARFRRRKDRRHLYESVEQPKRDRNGATFEREFADWRNVPSEAVWRRELREALRRGLTSLAPKYREVFRLRDIENRTIRETSALLGIPEGSVKTRLLRARLKMRDSLRSGFDLHWLARNERKRECALRRNTRPRWRDKGDISHWFYSRELAPQAQRAEG